MPLPRGSRPEGVAAAGDYELFVACLSGAVLHVDLTTKAVTKVTDEPLAALSGVKWDAEQRALFVTGTLSGKAFTYFLEPQDPTNLGAAGAPRARPGSSAGAAGAPRAPPAGALSLAQAGPAPWRVKRRVAVQLARLPPWYINDVTLTPTSALFTDSFSSRLFEVPRFFPEGSTPKVTSYDLGPHFEVLPGQFKANGIAALRPAAADATIPTNGGGDDSASGVGGDGTGGDSAGTAGGESVLVANLHEGNLYRVTLPAPPPAPSPAPAGVAAAAAAAKKALLGGDGGGGEKAAAAQVALPAVRGARMLLDGLWLDDDDKTVYAADNYHNRVVRMALRQGAVTAGAEVTCVIDPPDYKVPTTLAVTNGAGGKILWAVNAHLTTCLPFVPCPGHSFELIGVKPSDYCSDA